MKNLQKRKQSYYLSCKNFNIIITINMLYKSNKRYLYNHYYDFRHFSGTYFINKHYIKIITQAIGSYWTSAIKETEES